MSRDSSSRRPNVVLLFTDQQRRDTINAAGFPWMKTPNLDRLVQEGTWFSHAYSPNPVCIPARHCLLTGHNCEAHGYYANASGPMRQRGIPTMPQVLSDHGYYCGGVGKQHFLPANRHHGYDELHLMEELPRHVASDAYASHLAEEGLGHLRNIHGVRPAIYHQPQTAQMDAAHHGTFWVADESTAFIRRNADRPFYLMASFIHPHPPWDIPTEYQGLYDDAELPEPIVRSRRLPFPAEEHPRYGDTDSDEQRRAERAAYFTSISMVDEAVGRILAELEEQGILDETIIVFASDHGEMLQDKGFYQKALPYESASAIPMIVRAPGRLQPGEVRDDFVDLCDIMPTFLDAADIDYRPYDDNGRFHLVGSSLLRIDEVGGCDRSMQWVHFGTGRNRWLMQRDHRYKYIYWYNGGREECYDLIEDPHELYNLIGHSSLPKNVYRRLRDACFANERRHGPAQEQDAHGFPKAYDLQTYGPEHMEGSKYPLWSNMQFQTFGNRSGEWEGRRFLEEAAHAMGGADRLAEVPNAADLQRTLEEHYGYLSDGDGPPLWQSERMMD